MHLIITPFNAYYSMYMIHSINKSKPYLEQIVNCKQKKGLWQKSCQSPLFRMNGVQKLASAVISRNFTKIWEAIFVNSFLFLEADHFCHNYFLTSYVHISYDRLVIEARTTQVLVIKRFSYLFLGTRRHTQRPCKEIPDNY